MEINAETRFIGLLGSPVKQSFSAAMQNKAFQKLGLNYVYVPLEVAREDLETVVKGMVKMNYAGFNVTKPHKINILKYLNELDWLAKVIGAVNTVTIKDGILKGYNTDGTGFVRSLEVDKNFSVKDKNIFLLGCGGAAKAIAMACTFKGARRIYIANRTAEKAAALAAEINSQVRECSVAVPLHTAEMKQALQDSQVFINTTSVGMTPYEKDTPLEAKWLHKKLLVCDVIYNPLKTRLLWEAEQIGCKTHNGLGMLLYQGMESFLLWTEQEAPVQVMRKAINQAYSKNT